MKCFSLCSACLGLSGFVFGAQSVSPDPVAVLVERVEALERRLALIDRKFQVFTATSEQELNGASAIFGDADLLLQQAEHALRVEKNPDQAYRYLAALRGLHPAASVAPDTYGLAADLFKGLYFRHRHGERRGLWTTAEPIFMFQWLSAYFEAGADVFPQAEVEKLLLGMPMGVLRDYEQFAAGNPLMAKWQLSATRDNGIIQTITATKR